MQTFLDEYIEIEHHSKYHREQSQLLAQLLARHPNLQALSFADLLLLLEQLERHQTTIRLPLFAQVLYPVLKREIESGNMAALKVLLRYAPLLNRYYAMSKFSDGESEWTLVERYLQYDPDDSEVLQHKEALLRSFLRYSIHELPHGVLYDQNGANAEQCLELLDLLEDYTRTCQKLRLDHSADIHYYTTHFQGYRDYLLHRALYTNYLDYIQQHHLEFRQAQNYYDA